MSETTVGWQRNQVSEAAGEVVDRFAPDQLDAHASAVRCGLVLLLTALAVFPNNLFMDGDTGWHLGAGRWIVANLAVPMVDPFSHTFAGTPWTAHEWLAEVLMVGADTLAGWNGLAVLFGAAGAATFWMLARESFRHLPARHAALAFIAAACLLFPFALARPHMLVWPLLAGWTLMLLRVRERRAAPPLVAAAVMLLWTNLHASWIFGLGLAGLFGLESLIENPRDRRLLGRWLGFGLLSAAAAIVSPLGPAHVFYPFQVSGMKALSIIGEWRRSDPTTDVAFFVALVGLAFLIVRRWRDLPWLRVLLLVGLGVLAVLHARHQMLFTLVGFFVVLPMIRPAQAQAEPMPVPRWFVPALAGLALARLLVPYQFTETGAYPLTLLDKVPASIRAQPVLNEYSQGGPLVMLGIQPYIDGRADMYGDDFTFRAQAIAKGDMVKFREDVARYGIGWVTMQAGNELVAKLDNEPGWRRLASDRQAVIFVKR